MLTRLGIVVGCAATALLASACVSANLPEPDPTPKDSLGDYYSQTLDWEDCGGGAQCAELTVPKNYTDLAAGDFALALLRHETSGEAQGSLVLNPGGPGGSGVDYARAANAVLPAEVNSVYDIVGFDPRGVGASDPVECLTDAQTDTWLAENGKPTNPEEVQQLVNSSKEFGVRCADRAPGEYPYVDTESVVKDLDVLRSALGEDQLDYVGKSYGTLIGALYADEYPDKVGRMVLDGVLPPDLTSEEIGFGQARGFEDTLRRYVEDCQSKSDCPLPKESVDAGVKRIQKFLDDLGEEPINAQEGRPLTQSLGLGAILYHLYFPAFGDWNKLSDGLADGFEGNGAPLLAMYDERLERSPDGKYADNSQDAFYAVSCLDRVAEGDPAVLAERAKTWSGEAPTFGPYLAWSDLVCAHWPTAAKGEPHKVSAKGANPILVVSTTHDPATPYSWAQQLVADLDDAKLVTWDQDGHTAYGNGSSCVDGVVNAYLIDGVTPENNVSCPN